MNKLAKKIRELRLSQGLSQERLALAVQRDRSWIAHLERGRIQPSFEQLQKLAEVLNVPYQEFSFNCDIMEECSVKRSSLKKIAVKIFSGVLKNEGSKLSKLQLNPQAYIKAVEKQVEDVSLRAQLKNLNFMCEEALALIMALLNRGGEIAKVALSEVGFPLSLVGYNGASLNNVPQNCVLWAQGRRAVAAFGAVNCPKSGFCPPIVAVSTYNSVKFWLLDAKKRFKSFQCHSMEKQNPSLVNFRRLGIKGVNMENSSSFLDAVIKLAEEF